MTWLPLLLADPSPCLRQLVLRELFERADDDPEVRELDLFRETDPAVADLLSLQRDNGAWGRAEIGARGAIGRLQATSIALSRLGYLGFGCDHPTVRHGADFLFAAQRKDGAWPLARQREDAGEEGGYTSMPLQTALPLRGLAMCGYAADPRCERAYDWLLDQRLEDGAWPTGTAAGNFGSVAGYRKLAQSRWGCRSNSTGALSCLALHPQRRHSPEARRGLDLLLGRDTRDRHALGHEVARLVGAESARGFVTFYARFDVAQILDLCWRIGATLEDQRVAGLVTFVKDQQEDRGLWEYCAKPQASRWITFDLLRSLSRLGETGDWLSGVPQVPYQAYPAKRPRY